MKDSNILNIKEAFELRWLLVPKHIIDDGGSRGKFKETIRALYMNGYRITKVGYLHYKEE